MMSLFIQIRNLNQQGLFWADPSSVQVWWKSVLILFVLFCQHTSKQTNGHRWKQNLLLTFSLSKTLLLKPYLFWIMTSTPFEHSGQVFYFCFWCVTFDVTKAPQEQSTVERSKSYAAIWLHGDAHWTHGRLTHTIGNIPTAARCYWKLNIVI